MKRIALSINRTRKYNPDYAYMDEWEFLAEAVERRQELEPDDKNDDGRHFIVSLEFEYPVHPDQRGDMEQAVRDEYRRGCSCPHDCCGHMTGGAGHFKWMNSRLLQCRVDWYPNY